MLDFWLFEKGANEVRKKRKHSSEEQLFYSMYHTLFSL